MRQRIGPCEACEDGTIHEMEDGDRICTRCSWRERAANVRRFTFAALRRPGTA